MDFKTYTASPASTGTSVIGIKYDGGVVIAADTLGSYGSLARFKNLERVVKINNYCALGYSGDVADFQFLLHHIEEKVHEDRLRGDGIELDPKSLHTYVTRIMHNCRTRMEPLWNSYVIAGYKNDTPFLGYVDMRGVSYTDDTIASGFGKHLAIPQLRDFVENNKSISEQDAKDAIMDALKVLYYRDCRASRNYQMVTINNEGVRVSKPLVLDTNWEVAKYVVGYE